jgi:hypothetical protein
MKSPFESTVTGITTGGAKTAVEIAVPYSGIISRIVVNLSAGADDGYTVDIYSKLSYAGTTISALGYGTDVTPGTQTVIGKIMPTLTIASSGDLSTAVGELFDIAYPYKNMDANLRGMHRNLLHVVIDPGAAADQVYEITIAGLSGDL